jgi:hypothetical protein
VAEIDFASYMVSEVFICVYVDMSHQLLKRQFFIQSLERKFYFLKFLFTIFGSRPFKMYAYLKLVKV